MVALAFVDDDGTEATTIPEFVRARIDQIANGTLPEWEQFPLMAASTDTVRSIRGLSHNVVVKWLDALTYDDTPDAPRLGANADYIAYFGDGWNTDPTAPPQWNGDGTAGWVWINHEYVSGTMPQASAAPTGSHLTFARWLRHQGVLANDVESDVWSQQDIDTYIDWYKKQLGGSWLRIVQDPSTGEWFVDLAADAVRYDATDDTLVRLTGMTLTAPDHLDDGTELPMNVAVGIAGDCSGGQTPWGTIITAEENIQDYYGDLEPNWTSQQRFVPGMGFDPNATISFDVTPSTAAEFGAHSDPNTRHAKDAYGYLAEIDPGVASDEYDGLVTAGVGHKKLGDFGRARWENATFVTDEGWRPIPGQPITVYAADDRRGGRIFKWVSAQPYTTGMTRAQVRALMDTGYLYVAQFDGLDNATGNTLFGSGLPPTETTRGVGRWVELSLTSTDVAPNATALGAPGTTVGQALASTTWNGIGGFASDDDVRKAMFTAAAKIGIMELNRPEDLEWNPLDPSGTPRLYIAFTNHGRKTQVDQDGVLYDPATHAANSPTRPDPVGAIFVIEELDPQSPAASGSFTYFEVWHGTLGDGDYDAANPDNLAIDSEGGVWFGTDGNFGRNGHADSIYYLDLDPLHTPGNVPVPTWGVAFRVAAAPSDAEATGPAFTSDERTLFFNVQHPGEDQLSTWPQAR
jgi:hypothetical protein